MYKIVPLFCPVSGENSVQIFFLHLIFVWFLFLMKNGHVHILLLKMDFKDCIQPVSVELPKSRISKNVKAHETK